MLCICYANTLVQYAYYIRIIIVVVVNIQRMRNQHQSTPYGNGTRVAQAKGKMSVKEIRRYMMCEKE